MASSDYDRPPMGDHPEGVRPPPPIAEKPGATWTGPVGFVLAIIFVVLLLSAVLG